MKRVLSMGFVKVENFLTVLSMSFFCICGSIHCTSRLKKSNEMQQYADIYLLLYYSTCFGCPLHPKHVSNLAAD